MKFSIIVPVYNVEKYLDKCLNSIITQTYDNYEVIIVNDGSPDNSQKIIDKYTKGDKRFKSFITENRGLSEARNFAINKVEGDYILFLDSDDFFAKGLLNELNNELQENDVDLIRFSCVNVDENGEILSKENNLEYKNEKTENIIKELVTRDYVETACLYCYKCSFWKKYNFKYSKGKIHEDYGLTPLIIYYSQNITSINYIGYYYVQRRNSITKSTDYEKIKKGVYDMYEQYLNIAEILSKEKDNKKKSVILTYVSECALSKGKSLDNKELKKYIRTLRKDKVANKISGYNIKKIIKKILASINIKLYIYLFR